MTTRDRKPLALIVENDRVWREDIIVPQLEILGLRTISAVNALDGVRLAGAHGKDSEDPLDLVILDMHMPLTSRETDDCMEGGVIAMRQYADLEVRCPVVVFTAYPSYLNCVDAVKVGAQAYIPKEKHHTPPAGSEGGIDHLIETCQLLITSKEGSRQVMPPREWQQRNRSWLQSRFSGKWVAFVEQATAEHDPNFQLLREDTCDGIVVISGDTRRDVCEQILRSPTLFAAQPPIAMVIQIERYAFENDEVAGDEI